MTEWLPFQLLVVYWKYFDNISNFGLWCNLLFLIRCRNWVIYVGFVREHCLKKEKKLWVPFFFNNFLERILGRWQNVRHLVSRRLPLRAHQGEASSFDAWLPCATHSTAADIGRVDDNTWTGGTDD